jgi:hypothetical protein
MMKPAFPLVAFALLLPPPAAATEIFGGLHAQGVRTPFSLNADREGGTAVSVGVRGERIGRTPLQPYAFASLNPDGGTDFLVAGLSARFGSRLYVRPGLGVAIHNGSASDFDQPDRLAFGSRILFEPEVAVGAQLSERLSLEASIVHFSHAQIFGRQNPGIDQVGVRLNWRL